jgi:hypothetical protein
VLQATVLVCLIEGSYGSTESDELGDLSVLELEIALASLVGKRILAFTLRPESQEPRMLGLVKTMERVKGAEVREAREDELVDALTRSLQRETGPSRPK